MNSTMLQTVETVSISMTATCSQVLKPELIVFEPPSALKKAPSRSKDSIETSDRRIDIEVARFLKIFTLRLHLMVK